MKERPILFSGEMVRAILDGRKTQTRRIVKHREARWEVGDAAGYLWPFWPCYVYGEPEPITMRCPYGEPGDRLWVRECWRDRLLTKHAYTGDPNDHGGPNDPCCGYRATMTYKCGKPIPCNVDFYKWRPSIHMPRWASRINLEVKAVRVERVQEISEEDAKAEGVTDNGIGHIPTALEMGPHRYWFANLWDSINGKRFPWESNPWVWVVEFERVNDG